jgi:hypothetical protein
MRQVYPKKKVKKPRKSRPLPRKVHIGGEEWRWEHAGTYIKILSPDNRYFTPPISLVVPDDGGMPDPEAPVAVVPRAVKAYIEEHLI